MKKILRRGILYVFVLLLTSSLPTMSYAIDAQFYSANNILFVDPGASTDPCSASTDPGSSNVAIEDKIAQTMIVGFTTPDAATKATVQKFKFGGVYFNGTIDGSVNSQTFDSWNSGLPSQLLVSSDDEGGKVQRFLSDQKSAKEMGTMDTASLTTYASKEGAALLARGATNLLGPVLDLDTGNNNAISPLDRSFGKTAAVVSEKAGAYADGMIASNVGVTFKHFPGIGKNTANTDKTYQQLNMTIGNLSEDVAPYKTLINKSPKSAVMLANEVLTGWGTDPVSLNKNAVDYLRNTLSYSGVIMTDDIGVFAGYSSNSIPLTNAVVKAYTAGVTMPLFQFTDENSINAVIAAVKTQVPVATINAAYQKVMDYKKALGLKTTTTSSVAKMDTSKLATDVEARKQFIFQVLLGLGFTKEKAAAIWGNLYQESGQNLDPKALEAGGSGTPGYTGHGIVQWSWERWRTDYGGRDVARVQDAARQSDLTDFAPYPPKGTSLDPNTLLGFAKKQGGNWYDLGIQIEFIKQEVSPGGGRDPASYSQIKDFLSSTSTNVSDLTTLWELGYEGASASDANIPNRIAGATEALAKYGGMAPIDPSGLATGVVAGGNCATPSTTPATGSVAGPTGSGDKFTEELIKVPSGAYGRNIWYYNQANANLNALNSYYKQIGHSWQECGCGPTSAMTIAASFDGKPIADPAAFLQEIAVTYKADAGCSGVVSGLQNYFKAKNYDVVPIKDRSSGFNSTTKAQFDSIRKYLKDGYLIMSHTNGHFLGIYAADNSGNFYLFDPGARVNTEHGISFTEAQLNSGSGMGGPAAGYGLDEFWAVKPKA